MATTHRDPAKQEPVDPSMAIVGRGKTVRATMTRPADTTQYAAGDVIADATATATSVITFDAVVRNNGGGAYIHGATLVDSAAESTKPDLELWLFDTDLGDDNDNAAFSPSDAEMLTHVATIEFPVGQFKTGSGNGMCDGHMSGGLMRPVRFQCASGDDALYGVLVVRNAYTPISGEAFQITLEIDQD